MQWLADHPLCECCMEAGRVVEARITDHVIPHGGNTDLFWDEGNFQSLCLKCHNAKSATERL